MSHLVSRVVELFSSVCCDTITIFELNSNSYFKSFYFNHSRTTCAMLWSTALGTQMFKGNERTVDLFGMSCYKICMWCDNIYRHSGCHRAMKKLTSGSCVGMVKGQARGSVFTDPFQWLREKHTHTHTNTQTHTTHTHTYTHHIHTHTHTHTHTHYSYSLGALEFRQYQYWYLFFDGLDNWSGKYIACVMPFFISGNDCRQSAPYYLQKIY